MSSRIVVLVFALCIASTVLAGPPYFTDDPEPVEPHHWEFYVASQDILEQHSKTGTAPHVEINYGAHEDLQLHLITSFEYNSPGSEAPSHYGLGDEELGIKYRFVHETDSLPQIGVFPLVELPSGNKNLGLGNGKTQVFLPLWFQKSFGKWTTYGGGGFWINPGKDNRNYGYMGWQAQRKIIDSLSIGTEVFHITQSTRNRLEDSRHTGFNIGGVFDISEQHHILFSGGRDILGTRKFTGYLGYQITY